MLYVSCTLFGGINDITFATVREAADMLDSLINRLFEFTFRHSTSGNSMFIILEWIINVLKTILLILLDSASGKVNIIWRKPFVNSSYRISLELILLPL